jgi:hypothetical protein
MMTENPSETSDDRILGEFRHLAGMRPDIGRLQTGFHLRSEAERNDLNSILEPFLNDSFYIGLAGGRQAGKIYVNSAKIESFLSGNQIACDINKLSNAIPGLINGLPADTEIDISPYARKLSSPGPVKFAAWYFIYDIDIVIVADPRIHKFDINKSRGPLSHTDIDVLTFPPDQILMPDKWGRKVFLNSVRFSW